VFLSQYSNYVASITLRSEPPPTGLQLTKWYFLPQIEQMRSKLDEVRELGPATAEEWFKGLEVDAKEKAADAARWETWEMGGGFQSIEQVIAQMEVSLSYRHGSRGRLPPPSEMDSRSGNERGGAVPNVQSSAQRGQGMYNLWSNCLAAL
jgi:hypothetical protein